MAMREAGRATSKYQIICMAPDVCKTPPYATPIPYQIVVDLQASQFSSKNVNIKGDPAATMALRVPGVKGDEAGSMGGVMSNVIKGYCRPLKFTPSVRINGNFSLFHQDTLCFMNCAGPEGPFNTIGILQCMDAMAMGPVPSPDDPDAADPPLEEPTPEELGFLEKLDVFKAIKDNAGTIVQAGQYALAVAQNGFSPEAIIGGFGMLGGAMGLTGLTQAAGLASQGLSIAKTDWRNPASALSALTGVAGTAGALAQVPQLSQMSQALQLGAVGAQVMTATQSRKPAQTASIAKTSTADQGATGDGSRKGARVTGGGAMLGAQTAVSGMNAQTQVRPASGSQYQSAAQGAGEARAVAHQAEKADQSVPSPSRPETELV